MVSDSKSDLRKQRGFKSLPLRNFVETDQGLVRSAERAAGPKSREAIQPSERESEPSKGGVTERPKVHDWKSCVLNGTEGSNPSPSARTTATILRVCLWSRVTQRL